jgi:hypothetical protein
MGWIRETLDGHPEVWHSGGVIGATTRNAYFPDQRISVVVFANTAAIDETRIVREAFRALVPPTEAQLAAERERNTQSAPGEETAITAAVRAEYERWRTGAVDLTRFDATMRAVLNPPAVQQVTAALAALGAPTAFVYRGKSAQATGGTTYVYRVVTPSGEMSVFYSLDAAGKINGLLFRPAE